MTLPVVWAIAGSDSCGGAGIAADMHTFHQLGVRGCQIITAVTSQNLHNISDIFYLPPAIIRSQMNMLNHPAAIKIGMMGSVGAIIEIKQFLQNYRGFSVLDPLLIS